MLTSAAHRQIEMIQRLAWPLLKDDMPICEVFHIQKQKQTSVKDSFKRMNKTSYRPRENICKSDICWKTCIYRKELSKLNSKRHINWHYQKSEKTMPYQHKAPQKRKGDILITYIQRNLCSTFVDKESNWAKTSVVTQDQEYTYYRISSEKLVN